MTVIQVSQCRCGHMKVKTRGLLGKKGFHSCSKAEWRGVETTVTISQCIPIILCPLLPNADLVVEPK